MAATSVADSSDIGIEKPSENFCPSKKLVWEDSLVNVKYIHVMTV